MIEIAHTFDKRFNFKKYREMLGDHKERFPSETGNYHIFQAEYNGGIFAYVWFYALGDKTFFGGVSKRKCHELNVELLKKLFEFYKGNIYSKTAYPEAAFILRKMGFKKISENIYKYERE